MLKRTKEPRKKVKTFITSIYLVLTQMRLKRKYFKGRRYPSRSSIYFTATKNAVNICLTVWP